MEEKAINDYLSRDKLTNVLDKNFIVEAGAGSGKTTALVKRLVAMVESGIDVSSISCITFTKAAANEFYERFQKLLSKRAKVTEDNIKPASRAGDLGPVTNESAKKCREALNNIDLCFMGTIDAFVQKLMNEHPYEFNVPAKTSVISEDEETQYITQEYFNILNKDPFYDEAACNLLNKASSYISQNVLIQGIKMFLSLKANETKFPTISDTDFDLDIELADTKQHVEILLDILTDYYSSCEGAKLTAESSYIMKNKRILLGSWNRNTSLIKKLLSSFTKFTISKKVLDANKFYISDQYIEFNKNNGRFISKPFDDALNLIDYFVNGLGYLTMHKCANEIARKFQHFGYFTYADFIVSLRDSLRKDAASGGKIIKYIQQTRKYYMLDEFQDTNPLQVEIFFYLSAIEPKENYRDCHPMPGSLFIVGDPKQSIYRFNGADVQVFSDTQKLFENDANSEQLFLTRNFRSSKKLREWFNDTMPKTLKTGTDDTNYYDIPIDNVTLLENEATFHDVYLFKDKVVKSGKKCIYNYDQVCYLINTIVNNPKYTILAKDENDNKVIRKIMYRDIMLIIPNKEKMPNYMESFAKHKIPYFSEGKVNFDLSEALNEVKALLYALILPEDKGFVYRALLTKYVGLNESEIKLIFAEGNEITLTNELIGNIPEKIAKKYAKLANLYAKTKNFTYSAKMLNIIENTNIFERCSGEFIEYVYYAYELVKTACTDGQIVTPKDAVEFVQNINTSNDDYERCFSVSNDVGQGRVHLANLHKTKGLEAPVVILLRTDKPTPKHKTYRTERTDKGTFTYIFGIKVPNGHKGSHELENFNFGVQRKDKQPSTFKVEDEEKSEEAERRRLEYVAATRAMCALIISDPIFLDESGAEIVRKESYWDDMLVNTSNQISNVEIDFDSVSSLDVSQSDDASKLYENNINIINPESHKPSYKLTRPSKLTINKCFNEIEERDDYVPIGFDDASNKREEAATRGTLAHRLMELLVNSKGKMNKDSLIQVISNEYIVSYENNKMLNNLYDAITSGGFNQKNGSIPNDILNVLLNAKNVICESPFSFMDGDKLYHGVIDVLYESDDGWHIIDYKTNRELDVEHLEDEYRAQLNEYIKAVEMTSGIKVKDASIYHLDC